MMTDFSFFVNYPKAPCFFRFSKSDKYLSAPLRTSDKWLLQQITFEAHDNEVLEYQVLSKQKNMLWLRWQPVIDSGIDITSYVRMNIKCD